MDIVEFFETSSGKWFSHRTSHLLSTSQSEGQKSELVVDLLPKTDPRVANLCQHYDLDSSLAVCGIQITWSDLESKAKQSRSNLLVPIADSENPNQGKLLSQLGDRHTKGSYTLGADEALTLVTEDNGACLEERLWFASPNLRLRTSVLKQADGFSTASFCSEIRMGVTKPAQ